MIQYYIMQKTNPNTDSRKRYGQIKKPSRSPPGRIFWPVRTVLYVMIAISFWKVFLLSLSHEISYLIALPFALNLIANFLFSYLQFKLKNNILASIDILCVRTTLIRAMIVIYPYAPWILYIQIPYLLWVSFATVLQLTVTYINKK